MKLYLKELAEKQQYKALPALTKVQYFFTKKKFTRFFQFMLIGLIYHYHQRFFRWVKNRRERLIIKYKKRWVNRYNPQTIIYQTATDATYRSEKLSA